MESSLGQELIGVSNELRKLLHRGPVQPVYPGEFMALNAIYWAAGKLEQQESEAPGVKMGEISRKLHATKPATSKMINALEQKGYVSRVYGKQDRRIVYICLTQEGKEVIETAIEEMEKRVAQLVEKLGEDSTKELIRILRRLHDIIEEDFMKGD